MFMFTLHIAKILAESGFLCITRYNKRTKVNSVKRTTNYGGVNFVVGSNLKRKDVLYF